MSGSEPILGNTTKFSTQGEFVGKYGETALRFYLLGVARKLLPEERIRICWRFPLPERKTIEIIYSDERECARTKGTMKCGSGWVCPACMGYIAERRRLELETAIQRSESEYFTVMATFTSRHSQADRLKPLLATMLKAYGNTFEGRWWTDVKAEYMVRGAVRATEITYGSNGWHPHFHVLYFVSREMLSDVIAGGPDEYCDSMKVQFGKRWIEMLEKNGLSGSSDVAFDVRSADDDIAEYIAKYGRMPQNWTVNASSYEVAYAVGKTPKNGNFGVLDMLFHAERQETMKSLFLEYHHATKGKSALQWSKGLKKKLDIEIIRDEIAAQGVETETDRLIAEIDVPLWKYIVDTGKLGQVMTYANQADEKRLEWLLGRLGDEFQTRLSELPQFDLGI